LEMFGVVPEPYYLDELGRFAFASVPEGKYVFEVTTRANPLSPRRAKNEALAIREGETIKDLEVLVEVAPDLGNISGLVLDAASRRPVETFDVKRIRVTSPGEPNPVQGDLKIDRSQKGIFLITGISPGTTTLEITSAGYAREIAAVEVFSSQTTERTFNLAPGGHLSGYIKLNGEGRSSGYARLYRDGQNPLEGVYAQGAKNGHYELKGLAEGEYWVRAGARLTEVKWLTVGINNLTRIRIEPGKDTRLDFEFQGNAGITGDFTCADKSLDRVVLILDPQRYPEMPILDRACASVLLGESDRYEIKTLSPGTYTVIARCVKKGGTWEPVNNMEKSRTVTLAPGQIERVDFIFP